MAASQQPQLNEARLGGSAIQDQYEARTPQSGAAFERAKSVLAGGTSRQTSFWLPYPLTLERGEGAFVFDADGHRYIDLINNFTALIHGHCYPPAQEALARQIKDGVLWSANNHSQSELAEEICGRIASVERVRFCNSGSEASSLGLKIARAATGRSKVLMARFGYHGMVRELEAGTMNAPTEETLVGDFNNIADFEAALAAHGHEIAAVVLEPMLGAGGVLIGDKTFFDRVAAAARRAGALFVLDEVQTFRLHAGGLQTKLALSPDLTLLGKFIGGGLPAGAVGGRAEIMSVFNPEALKAYHSGTFNGNPASMAAGAITVKHLTQAKIDDMDQLGERLRVAMMERARKAGLPLSVNRAGSLLNIFFMESAPKAVWDRTDADTARRFHLAALNQGVMIAPRGFIVLSTIMNDALIDESAERMGAAMHDVAKEIN